MKTTFFDTTGKKTKEVELPKSLFGTEVNEKFLSSVVVRLQANAREPYAHTKIRSERAGGGIKPWKQKGTGRARAGSVRSPIWRKGGVTFGPRSNRNFDKKINVAEKRKARLMALSLKANTKNGVLVIEDLKTEGKTKKLADLIKKLPAHKTVLLVVQPKDNETKRAAKNIPSVEVVTANTLPILSLLKQQTIVFTGDAYKAITKDAK